MEEISLAYRVTKVLVWLALKFFPLTIILIGVVGGGVELVVIGILLAIGIYGYQLYRFIRTRRSNTGRRHG